MKVCRGRRFLVVLWLVIAVSGLSAQERPVLTDSIVQNFINNLETIDDSAFSGIEDEEDYLGFAEGMSKLQGALAAYFYGEDDDFSGFRASFLQVKSIRSPGIERVFAQSGLGQRGIEVFFVITLGMTIGLMESEIETILSDIEAGGLFDPDMSEDFEELEYIRNKLVMMRSLIHPDDMAVLDKNFGALFGIFSSPWEE